MKICEVCGAEEKLEGLLDEQDDVMILGVCERCMNDFRQPTSTQA